ncbi:MAG: hypothetical protein N3G22_01410 [Candidatus Micrarchaeota archaeon]|nr:hypothetical protein [Candidatus Micrarchaeota archaeon]
MQAEKEKMQTCAMRAQAATEVLVLVGFALAFILPFAFLFLSTTWGEIGKSSTLQAKIAVRTIADEAGEVYLQGPGSKKVIYVYFPSGVVDGGLNEGIVRLTVEREGLRQDIVSYTFANISGSLSGKRIAGIQRIRLQYVFPGDYVNISYVDSG